jgi:hypothetical protein
VKYKIIVILGLALCLNLGLLAQDTTELERRNGFKTIKLGSPIDSVKGAVFKKDFIERKEFAAKKFITLHPDYNTIGEVTVKKVELLTYNGLIYEIHVYVPKDPRVMASLEKAFGAATFSVRMKAYFWKAETLSLIYQGDKKLVHLTYRSAPMVKRMYADKNKKAEDIMQGF